MGLGRHILSFFRRTPTRTFVLCPLLTLVWTLASQRGSLKLAALLTPSGLLLMLIGYLLHRKATNYRVKQSGGGRGEVWQAPPERLITSGPYNYTRNPVYVGHLVYLSGVAIALSSTLGVVILIVTAVGLNVRVLKDERRLTELFGPSYVEYKSRVRRWIPFLF